MARCQPRRRHRLQFVCANAEAGVDGGGGEPADTVREGGGRAVMVSPEQKRFGSAGFGLPSYRIGSYPQRRLRNQSSSEAPNVEGQRSIRVWLRSGPGAWARAPAAPPSAPAAPASAGCSPPPARCSRSHPTPPPLAVPCSARSARHCLPGSAAVLLVSKAARARRAGRQRAPRTSRPCAQNRTDVKKDMHEPEPEPE